MQLLWFLSEVRQTQRDCGVFLHSVIPSDSQSWLMQPTVNPEAAEVSWGSQLEWDPEHESWLQHTWLSDSSLSAESLTSL